MINRSSLAPNVVVDDIHGQRRQLVSQHKEIHGVDYISISSAQEIWLHLIAPQNDKPLPPLEKNQIIMEWVKDTISEHPVFTIDTDDKSYIIKLLLETPIAPNTLILVKVNHPLFDHFFSDVTYQASMDTSFHSEETKEQILAPLPRLDYLSKDYDSFKKLIISELQRSSPDWDEDNPSDMMVMLSEILAYAGDLLSYEQDVVTTEAYLDTARFDLSLKRHCRLLDYPLLSHVNARVWMCIDVDASITIPKSTPFFANKHNDMNSVLSPIEYKQRCGGKEIIFESMHNLTCLPEFNQLEIFTYGTSVVTIKAGCTQLAIKGHVNLKEGQLIALIHDSNKSYQVMRLFDDADHRHDRLSGNDYSLLTWYKDDALKEDWNSEECSLNGNIILADRGETLANEPLNLHMVGDVFYASVRNPFLIAAEPYHETIKKNHSALHTIEQDPYQALDALIITESNTSDTIAHNNHNQSWKAVYDFMNSTVFSKHVVVEKHQGCTNIRFGNGVFGAVPNPMKYYEATYRVTIPTQPHVAARVINQIYMPNELDEATELITNVRNLNAAIAAATPEDRRITKMAAPYTHKSRLSLTHVEEYIQFIKKYAGVRDVIAEKGWSGSEILHIFYIYPSAPVIRDDFLHKIMKTIEPMKMINHNIHLKLFQPLPIYMSMTITLEKNVTRNKTLVMLKQLLSDDPHDGILADKHFTFNTPLYQSDVITKILRIPEISNVVFENFQSLNHYATNQQMNDVSDAIIPRKHEIIQFKGINRHSIITINVEDAAYV